MEAVNKDRSVVPPDHAVLDYLMKILKSLVIREKRKIKSTEEVEEPEIPIGIFNIWLKLDKFSS